MRRSTALVGLLLAGALSVVGCKKEPTVNTAAQAGNPNSTTNTQTASPPTPIHGPGATAPATMPAITDSESLRTSPVPSPTTLPALSSTAPVSSTGGSSADAQSLLDDASKNVEAKNWDGARGDFDKLNAMRSQLLPSMQEKIRTAEAKFVAAKAGVSIPSLPALGGSTPAVPSEPNK